MIKLIIGSGDRRRDWGSLQDVWSRQFRHNQPQWDQVRTIWQKVKSKQKVYFITIIPAKATTMRSSEDYLTKKYKKLRKSTHKVYFINVLIVSFLQTCGHQSWLKNHRWWHQGHDQGGTFLQRNHYFVSSFMMTNNNTYVIRIQQTKQEND